MNSLRGPRPPSGRSHGRRLPCAPVADALISGFSDIRLSASDAEASLADAADRLSLPRSGWTSGRFDILALSGGAAGGAYGAGAVTGWTATGTRPEFALVTGVSTGALIAPLAFLGPDWDDRLKDAYTGGHARQLLSPRRMASVFSGGLLKSDALQALVEPFADMDLIEAVAAEHARGRRLLVATTDLDHQASCIWDMGAIASHGGPRALELFRQVLVASASLPGIFSPQRFATEYNGCAYEEMHVDGGVSAPLFLMPEALLRWNRLGRRLRSGRVHVIVNTMLDPPARATASHLPAVMIRSFETMLRFSYRQSLVTATTLCAAKGIPLYTASIPAEMNARSLLDFDTASMETLFEEGYRRAQSGTLWSTRVEPAGLEKLVASLLASRFPHRARP